MSTKDTIKLQVHKLSRELSQRGAIILRAPVLIRGMECVIRFLLGAVLSGAEIFGFYAPFGLGFVGASGSGMEGFAALLGACAGYLSTQGLIQGLRYGAAAILIYSVAFAFYDVRLYRTSWFMPLLSALLSAATGFVYLSELGWTPAALIFFATETFLVGASAYFYRLAFAPWTRPGDRVEPDRREWISLLLLGGTLLLSLAQVNLIWDISLGRALAALGVMTTAWLGGVGLGAAVGVAVGLGMDVALDTLPLCAAAFAFSGLVTGLTRRKNRLTAALCYVLANAAAVLWAWSAGNLKIDLLYEVFLASVLFLLLPTSLLKRAERFFPRPAQAAGAAPHQAQNYVRLHLERQAAAFRTLCEELRSAASLPAHNDGDTAAIFDRAADRVCRSCALRDNCWQRDYVTTYNALNDALPAMLERGRGMASDFPGHFTGRCLHFSDFLAAANGELTALLTRRQYRARLQGSRAAVCRQYGELATLLNTAAAELSCELSPDPVREKRLRSCLARRGVDGEAAVYYDGRGHLRAEVRGKDLSALEDEKAQQDLESTLDIPLRPGERTHVRGGEQMTFLQAEPLSATAGIAARSREGETVSGDGGAWFKTEEGTLYLLLCDGMGSGPEAAQDSSLALRLLEDFLRAGVEPEPALATVSGALALRGEINGGFTTIDLLQLDLFTGEGGVYKLGAAPTYLRRGATVTRLTGSALPAGLAGQSQSAPDVTRFQLGPGDLAVLISDGVSDGREDSWLRTAIAQFREDSPRRLALSILEGSETASGGADDRTVVVLRLDKRRDTPAEQTPPAPETER